MASKISEAPRPTRARPTPPARVSVPKSSPTRPADKPQRDRVTLHQSPQTKPGSDTRPLTRGLTENFSAPAKPAVATSQPNPSSDPGQKSVDLARRFEGMLSQDVAGKLGSFGDAGRKTNNCADFVSSVLSESGRGVERTEDVSKLRQQLLDKGWQVVPQDQAKPGDVWMTTSDKHGSRHTELVTTAGGTHTIGSNNIASRQPQQQIFEREKTGGLIYGFRPAPVPE